MAPPVLEDFQFQFRDDGVLLNGDPNTGEPFVDVLKVSGLDSATYRTSQKDTEGRDGSTVEAEFESSRTIIVEGIVYGQTHDQMEPYIDDLKANFAVNKEHMPFYFKAAGVDQRLSMVKCISGFRSDWDAMRRIATASFSVTLQAGDPIIYGANQYIWSGALTNTPMPGFEFPFEFPFDFGEYTGGVIGAFTATHYGNRPAPFVATFTGNGAHDIGLRHEGLGQQVTFNPNLVLNLGDELVVDFNTRKVLFNGSPRRGAVAREGWFLLQPNGPNDLRLLSGAGTAAVSVATRNAWR